MSKTKTDLGPYDEAKVDLVVRLTKVKIDFELTEPNYDDEDKFQIEMLARQLLTKKRLEVAETLSVADKHEIYRRRKEKYHALNKEGKYVEAQLWKQGGAPIGWSWRPPGWIQRGER
jgi:hypothetical protein